MDRPITHTHPILMSSARRGVSSTLEEERASTRYCCWAFLAVVFLLIIVDAIMWLPSPYTPDNPSLPRQPRQPSNGTAYGWAAIVLAIMYMLIAGAFVWIMDDGVDLVFAVVAILVFIFAGATIATSSRSSEDSGGWVAILLFCILLFAFLGACGHATWRWRGQVARVANAKKASQGQGQGQGQDLEEEGPQWIPEEEEGGNGRGVLPSLFSLWHA